MADPAAILVAARDEEQAIGATVAALKERFPASELVVADDGSRDGTAAEAERAGGLGRVSGPVARAVVGDDHVGAREPLLEC